MSLATFITINGKELAVPVTAVDQVVNFWNPTAGAKRFKQRLAMTMSGAYTGADRTRRANQKGRVAETDADSAILSDLPTLREESQHMNRNNAIAAGAIKTNVTKVVGTGLKVNPQIDRKYLGITDAQGDAWEIAARREYLLATETREIDAERQLPFSLIQNLAFLKTLEDGDVFVNLARVTRPGSPYSLKLQLIEGARVCNPDGKADTKSLAGGVGRDNHGAPNKIHVLNSHPGNWRLMLASDKSAWTWKQLDLYSKKSGAPLVLHLFDKVRPGQSRGVPYLAPVIELIKQLGKYTDAEVMAAVVSGMLTVFVTNETGNPNFGPAPTIDNPDGTKSAQLDLTGLELGYGTVAGLMPGESISTVAPGRPNVAFDPFVMAVLRQIGVALEIPFELLIKHFTSSYSASRAALEEAWDYFSRRRHWLVTMLCQPVYEAVISEAIARGRLSAPGFFADPLIKKAYLGSVWIGDAPSQLDPKKEVEAAVMRMNAKLSTLEEERAMLVGRGWEAIVPQLMKEAKILGLMPQPKQQIPAETEDDEE